MDLSQEIKKLNLNSVTQVSVSMTDRQERHQDQRLFLRGDYTKIPKFILGSSPDKGSFM